ncbi:MAG: Cell division coordinator CpoB, partial [Devosia sp.]|nr:Cell division coordinator CpoB [Devosia sp.]
MVKRPPTRGSAFRPAFLATLLASALAAPALAATGPLTVDPTAPLPPRAIAQTRIHVAQNQQSSAELLVRIQDLEELIRTLTGRVEGLEFQLTQMQTQLAKQTEDNEFRFQQLEGGAGGKPQAAAPTDGATPSATLPQTPAQQAPAVAATPEAPAAGTSIDNLPLADLNGEPMDSLGDSADPLLKGGIDQLGTVPEDQLSIDAARPLDLSLGGGKISTGDAKAQYEAGYDAITRGDYAFAEDQFQQFVALYPD